MALEVRPAKPTDAPVFSHSQLNVVDTCLKKWYYQYKREKILRPSQAMRLGSAIHAFLEVYYKHMIATGGRSRSLNSEELAHVFNEAFDGKEFESTDLIRAQTLIHYYMEVVEKLDRFLVLFEAEQHFYVPWILPSGRKIYFEAIVDLIAMDERDHKLVVIDHKSAGKAWSQQAADLDSQLPMYMGLLQSMNRPIGKAIINNIITYNYKNLRQAQTENKLFKRLYIEKTETQIRNFMLELSKRIDRTLDLQDKDEYPMRLNKDCGSCSYWAVCDQILKGNEAQAELTLQTFYIDKQEARQGNQEFSVVLSTKKKDSPVGLDAAENKEQTPQSNKAVEITKVDW